MHVKFCLLITLFKANYFDFDVFVTLYLVTNQADFDNIAVSQNVVQIVQLYR